MGKEKAAVKQKSNDATVAEPAAKVKAARQASQERQASEKQQNEEAPQYESSHMGAVWRDVISFSTSLVFHATTLIVLALWSLGEEQPEAKGIALASSVTQQQEQLEEIELDPEVVLEEIEMQNADVADAPADFGEIDMPTEMAVDVGTSNAPPTDAVSIGKLFGTEGQGLGTKAIGGGGSFFGQQSYGRKFVFVLDNSLSMNNGKFETMLIELMKAVESLDQYTRFYIVFYSDTAYPLFWPKPVTQMIPATQQNKEKLQYWLETVDLCLKTEGTDACKLALKMNPDVIYILGDGAFTDKAHDFLMSVPKTRITIHTLGMNMKPEHAKQFAMVAEKHGGNYKDVGIFPEAAQLAKTNPRERHSKYSTPWGVKLPKK